MPMSFEEIMRMPASSFKPPSALPVGTYHCVIEGQPEKGQSSQKQTDFLKFKFKIVGIGKGVDPAAAAEQGAVGKSFTHDYYVTESAVWRLREMLEHAGIEAGGEPGTPGAKPLPEMINESPNKQILVTLKHEISQDGQRVFHRVANTAHVSTAAD